MKERQEKDISGDRIVITQLPALDAFKLLNRLGRAITPALTKAVGNANALKIADLDLSKLTDAIVLLFDKLTEAELEGIIAGLLAGAQLITTDAEGPKATPLVDARNLSASMFNLHYRGRLMDLIAVLQFAVEVNYGDFFVFLRGLKGTAQGTIKKT